MSNYNPLATFIASILDKYVDDYLQTCRETNQPASLEDFKNVLNYNYENGTPSRICELLAIRYQLKTNKAL